MFLECMHLPDASMCFDDIAQDCSLGTKDHQSLFISILFNTPDVVLVMKAFPSVTCRTCRTFVYE